MASVQRAAKASFQCSKTNGIFCNINVYNMWLYWISFDVYETNNKENIVDKSNLLGKG